MGSAAVDRFGEVAGVGEEDCFSAVVEDVGKELGWMRVASFGKGSCATKHRVGEQDVAHQIVVLVA